MLTSSNRFLKEQYGDSSKLDIRVRLHEQYSTNKKDWHEWVFEQIGFAGSGAAIEFGCGSGVLWGKNRSSIPSGWSILLTDFSEGMVTKAKETIGALPNVTYRTMDIQAVDAETNSFDIVIANHMLYHVPNLEQALSEVQRILKPGGKLYAATNGKRHMGEIYDLVREYDPSLPMVRLMNTKNFGLENGEEQLRKFFADVQLAAYESDLQVTRSQDLADYIFSIGTGIQEAVGAQGGLERFIPFLESKKNEQGHIPISKHSGLFICTK